MGVGGNDAFDRLNSEGVQGTLTVGTTAVEVKVGGSALAGRRLLIMYSNDNTIYWGYSSGVTTSTGIPLVKDQNAWIPVGDEITVYAIADGSGKTLRVHELA